MRKIEKCIYVDKSRYPKIFNPHSYRYELERLMLKCYWDKNNKTLEHFKKIILAEELEEEGYLAEIIQNANEWKDKNLNSN